MGRHSLWHVDVVPVAVVGVHSVWVWRRTLVCSSVEEDKAIIFTTVSGKGV